MREIEDKIYRTLSRTDEWADVDGKCELERMLFGDDEWSGVREAQWMENYKKNNLNGDGFG